MTDRSGIEIDFCPSCRGIWLDRGELDKIIERSAAVPAAASYSQPTPYQHGSDDRHGYGRHHRKKKSFLSDIFDFD